MKRKSVYWVLPFLGVLLCLWYIQSAAGEGIYSDYIRLVNTYLPDVWNPDKFFVPDILTRIPINYLGRILNIALFGFSTTADRVTGVIGLGISALVLGYYSNKRSFGAGWYLILMVVLFSLNKWEMLTNGSGWSHFLAFGFFYYHYMVLDRVWSRDEKSHDRKLLMILPFIITLFIAGPYCAIYSVTLIIAYIFCTIIRLWKEKKWDRSFAIYLICTLLPLLLYMWSNSYAVENHAGAVSEPMLSFMQREPVFFVRFFLKSFASMLLSENAMFWIFGRLPGSDWLMAFLGMVVLAAYLMAVWLNFRYRLYRKTILPLLFLTAGGLNHVLILVSRWIFINENYGMSSRYALQFQIGILGILLTFGFTWRRAKKEKKKWLLKLLAGFAALLLAGSFFTNVKEIQMAPYREKLFEERAAMMLQFESLSDETLQKNFEYRQGEEGSGAKVRAALTILKEHHWNVFRDVE